MTAKEFLRLYTRNKKARENREKYISDNIIDIMNEFAKIKCNENELYLFGFVQQAHEILETKILEFPIPKDLRL